MLCTQQQKVFCVLVANWKDITNMCDSHSKELQLRLSIIVVQNTQVWK